MPAKPTTEKKPAFKYRQQFGLIIQCVDEAAQQREYNKLRKLGYQPKVVTV